MEKSGQEETASLSKIFDEALESYNEINNTAEATNSESVQTKISKTIAEFETATRLVSLTALFSTNETVEEIATNDIKYFLLPALLGMLQLKRCGGDRREIVDKAEVYFKDFLKRCYEYNLTEHNINKPKPEEDQEKSTGATSKKTEIEIITALVNNRHSKIERYKEQKQLEQKLSELKRVFDEDVKREFYLTMIQMYIYQVIDELKSIEMERPMLEMFAAQNAKAPAMKHSLNPKHQPTPLKPFIITKDDVQKAVFGAGYPALPTMTVDEFYDKRVRDGVFPDPNKKVEKTPENMSLQELALAGIEPNYDAEDAEKEQRIEADDPELLDQMRRRDEMKDEFRRGYGNRMNRS